MKKNQNIVINKNIVIKDNKVIACLKNSRAIIIASGASEIADFAFSGNKQLRKVVFEPVSLYGSEPVRVERIGRGTFSGCSSLSRIKFGIAAAVLEESVFEGIGAHKVSLPECLAVLEPRAFASCKKLTRFSGPGVAAVQREAFADCDRLRHVELPAVNQIQEDAFKGCASLETLTLGKNLKILSDSFKDCKNLKAIYFEGSPAQWARVTRGALYTLPPETVIFCKSRKNRLIFPILNTGFKYKENDSTCLERVNLYAKGKLLLPKGVVSTAEHFCVGRDITSVTFKEGFERLGYHSFMCCNKLKSVVFPSTLKTIEELPFEYCTSLSIIRFLGSKAQWNAIDKDTLDSDGSVIVSWTDGIRRPLSVICNDGVIHCKPDFDFYG